MPTTRELLQQALEAMEVAHPRFGIATQKHAQAVAAIRAHLERPEPEPVAFRRWHDEFACWDYADADNLWAGNCKSTPLYTKEQL